MVLVAVRSPLSFSRVFSRQRGQECAYTRRLLGLPVDPGEDDADGAGHGRLWPGDNEDSNNGGGNKNVKLAKLIKTILMLNDPNIIEHVTVHAPTFESFCAVLEHDPDPRRRDDHLRFLRERARFRTVMRMYDEESRGTFTGCSE